MKICVNGMTKKPLQNKVSHVKAMANIRPSASSDGHSRWVSSTPFLVYFLAHLHFNLQVPKVKTYKVLPWDFSLAVIRPLTAGASSILFRFRNSYYYSKSKIPRKKITQPRKSLGQSQVCALQMIDKN